MKKKWVLLILILGIIQWALLGCTSKTPVGMDINVDTIRIGVMEPLSGTNEEQGLLERQGIELAHELYPTVLDQPVELICVDSQSDIIKATKITEQLLKKHNISVVIGSFGSLLSMASGSQYQEMQIPAIGSTCSNPLVTLGNPYYFRVCATDLLQGNIMAQYAFQEEGLKKVAVLKDESDSNSVALGQVFIDEFIKISKKNNGIVYDGKYNSGDKDYKTQLQAIKDSQAEAVFIPGKVKDAINIIKQIEQLDMDIQIIGGDWWETNEIIELEDSIIENIIFCSLYDYKALETEQTEQFYQAFKAKYGEEAEPADETILAFDAYLLAIDAIKRAESTKGNEIRETLAATECFIGASGMIKIDENGDALRNAVIKTIKKQTFVTKAIKSF